MFDQESPTRRSGVVALALAALCAAPHPARAAAPDGPPLDLAALIAEAEAASPRILAARARLEAAGHAASPAEALPDPMASLAWTNDTLNEITLGESIMSNLTFSWSQEVPYPGKRRLAGDVARAEVAVAREELGAVLLDVRARVKAAYVDLNRIDRTRRIVLENRKLLEALAQATRARYENGQAILENVLRAETEVTRIEIDLARLDEERAAASAALAASIGRRDSAPLGPALEDPDGILPEADRAEAAALERSPYLLASREKVGVGEARLAVAERDLKPDFVWSAAYVYRAEIEPMVMGMVGLKLPLFKDRKQAEAITRARIDLEAARHDVEENRLAIVAQVRDLLARAQRAGTVARLYGDGVLPQAMGARDASMAAYANGQTEFVTVIGDALAVLRDEVEQETQRAQMLQALASLEALTGMELVMPGGKRP